MVLARQTFSGISRTEELFGAMAYAMAPTVIEYVKSQMMQIAAYAHRDPEELLIVLMAPIM